MSTQKVMMKALEGEAGDKVKLAIASSIERTNAEIVGSMATNGVPASEWGDRVIQVYIGAAAGVCVTSGVVTKEMFMEKCSEVWDLVKRATGPEKS